MITKTLLKSLREDIETALKTVGDKHNVQLIAGAARYTDSYFTMKIEGSTIGSDGSAQTREAEDFVKFASLYGLKGGDLNRSFTIIGEERTFTIIGMKRSAKKYPILCKRDDGKVFKFPTDYVLRCLAVNQ